MGLTEASANAPATRWRRVLLLGCLLAPLAARAGDGPLEALFVEVEAGPLKVFRNELGFGAEGTRYSEEDIGQDEPLFITKRASVEARLGERHGVVLLYAPLSLTTRAALTRDIRFLDTLFPTGTPVDHTYTFDGYRASYVYRLINRERLQWDVGVSLQIRSALVELRSQDGALYARDSDIGPVPALKTRLTWQPSRWLWAALEVDGLVNPTDPDGGALYDAALTLGVPLDDDATVSPYLRLRFYGGGVDNPDGDPPLYSFANFGFALLGVRADAVELLD